MKTTPHLLDTLTRSISWLDGQRGAQRWRLIAVFLLLTQAAFAFGGWQHTQTVNDTVYWADQGEYYRYAARVAFTDGAYAGDFNRAPLFNWLQALHYQPGEHPQDFHARSLYVAIALGMVALLFIFFVFLRYMRLSLAVIGYLVVAFMLYLFKAPYLQAEVLYYTASFAAFVLMVELLLRPSFWGAGLLGFAAAVAHLSKSSVLAGLLAFVVVYLLVVVVQQRAPWRPGRGVAPGEAAPADTSADTVPRRLGILALAVAVFAVGIFPDVLAARAVDGPPLYNVNTTLYIWVDDWEQVKDGIQMERPQNAYPHHLSDDDIPSLHNYLERNGVQGLVTQTWEGLQFQVRNHLQTGYGYQHYVVLLAVAGLVFPAWLWRQEPAVVRRWWRGVWPVVLFAGLFFVGYGLLYSFYVPINPGKRFWQALIVPFVWLVLWGLQQPRLWELRLGGRSVLGVGAGVVLVLVVVHSVLQVAVNIRAFSGG